MSDPYKVLGVSPDATEEEIKKAYRELTKKYYPDNYANSPLEDLASEKMQEINVAYDEIMKMRKNGRKSGYAGDYSSSGSYYSSARSSNYSDVRTLIRKNRIADAEQILEGVPYSSRDAEWYFLRGTIYYKKGWTEEAYNNWTTATEMDPGNGEYRTALNALHRQRSGAFGGYNVNNAPMGCSGCDVCSGLLCADCCCECMGGDLIRCC